MSITNNLSSNQSKDFQGEAKNLKDSFLKQAKDFGNDAKDSASRLSHDSEFDFSPENLQKIAKQAGKSVSEIVSEKQDQLKQVARKCASEVKNNPVRSLLIAAAAGAVVSLIIKKICTK